MDLVYENMGINVPSSYMNIFMGCSMNWQYIRFPYENIIMESWNHGIMDMIRLSFPYENIMDYMEIPT